MTKCMMSRDNMFYPEGMDGQRYPLGSRSIQKYFQIAPVELRTLAARTRTAQVTTTLRVFVLFFVLLLAVISRSEFRFLQRVGSGRRDVFRSEDFRRQRRQYNVAAQVRREDQLRHRPEVVAVGPTQVHRNAEHVVAHDIQRVLRNPREQQARKYKSSSSSSCHRRQRGFS